MTKLTLTFGALAVFCLSATAAEYYSPSQLATYAEGKATCKEGTPVFKTAFVWHTTPHMETKHDAQGRMTVALRTDTVALETTAFFCDKK